MRFFVDNCLAIRHARALNEMLKPEHEFKHLQDKFDAGVKDVEWLTKLGEERDWVIISGDYRIGKSAHEKEAWRQSRLTAFFLAKGWTNLPPLVQHSKLASIIEEICEKASCAKPGTGFLVSVNCKIEETYRP